MTIDLRFLFKLFLRRLHYLLLVALPVAVAGVWLAYNLPPSYSAEARLLVESPQVPSDLAASTMRAETAEVLQVISQRILTRANMLDLSREFRLHADQADMNADAIVADMRRRARISLPGRGAAASFVNVSFTGSNPRVVTEVTNELVTRILRENVALRTATTTQTLQFFDEEVSRLEDDLTRQTGRIIEFQEANRDALPDSLAFRRARQTTQQERLLQLERDLASLRDRRERLVSLFERTGRIDVDPATLTAEQRQLRELQNQLSNAQAIFAPDNPRIRVLRRQIEALEETVATQAADMPGESEGMTLYDMQLSDIDGQIQFIRAQIDSIQAEVEGLRVTIEATPSNAIALNALERDLANIQAQYNQAIARRAQARTGERIEAQSRGQRIIVLEYASVPDEPSRPNRRALAAAGVGGGLAMGFGFVTLLELLKTAVRRPAEITARMGVPPFASIPYLRSRRQILVRRVTIWGLLILVSVGAAAGLYVFDQQVMPLDMAFDRVLSRTGIEGLIALFRGAAQ
ncbi:Wzz/FepE/Etk N-terminal domain-containing protein [Pararhodobacter sp. SW119]|uniref:GumC family protein n=1 Tax=Pararhodobacter sp. SW119 TaxID=2780075 RepID=UPI001AE053E3|nr:Wzz/FepE/Etk N-terminal domain-containing protein [Pararhodobacter sp. SW119]